MAGQVCGWPASPHAAPTCSTHSAAKSELLHESRRAECARKAGRDTLGNGRDSTTKTLMCDDAKSRPRKSKVRELATATKPRAIAFGLVAGDRSGALTVAMNTVCGGNIQKTLVLSFVPDATSRNPKR